MLKEVANIPEFNHSETHDGGTKYLSVKSCLHIEHA